MSSQAIELLRQKYGSEFGTDAIHSVAKELNTTYATLTKYLQMYKTSRGHWNLDVTREKIDELEETFTKNIAVSEYRNQNLVPEKNSSYVPFGNFSDIKKVIQSGLFYPIFITGLSGNGKTMSVEQACAFLKREMIRVNITVETDEDDLVGGFRLTDGETVFHNGPVIEAMERGAVLLLDECLDENEEVMVGTINNHQSMKLSDMNFNTEYPIVSFNMETGELENDTGSIISDKDDIIYEVELENGKTIRLNSKHPFIIKDKNGNFVEKTIDDGLSIGDEVITFD